MSASETADFWIDQRTWLLAAIKRTTDAEAVVELSLALVACEVALSRLAWTG